MHIGVHPHTLTHTHMHARTHARMHAHTHIHTHSPTHSLLISSDQSNFGLFILCAAAEEVVKRPHTVSNTPLRVVSYKPPGPPTKVKVSGLTPKATDELLLFYFEKAGDVEEVKLDSKKGEAVVIFAKPASRWCYFDYWF